MVSMHGIGIEWSKLDYNKESVATRLRVGAVLRVQRRPACVRGPQVRRARGGVFPHDALARLAREPVAGEGRDERGMEGARDDGADVDDDGGEGCAVAV